MAVNVQKHDEVDMGLVAHAKRELELAGLVDPDDGIQTSINNDILELIETFANQGHSGSTAPYALGIFWKLVNRETLSANPHNLCMDVSEYFGGKPALQDIRDSRWFSYDGGVTWHNVDDSPSSRQGDSDGSN